MGGGDESLRGKGETHELHTLTTVKISLMLVKLLNIHVCAVRRSVMKSIEYYALQFHHHHLQSATVQEMQQQQHRHERA